MIGKRSPKAIRNALENLPKGADAYSQAYKSVMERIEAQVPDQRELARQTLMWMSCARRPLFASELQCALAIEPGEGSFDQDNVPQIEDIISACAGLIAFGNLSNSVCFVHSTIQDYFRKTRDRWFPEAETELAMACMTYVSYDTFKEGDLLQCLRWGQENEFHNYAFGCWGLHARNSPTSHSLAFDLLLNRPGILSVTIKLQRLVDAATIDKCQNNMAIALSLAICFNFKAAIEMLLRRGAKIDILDHLGITPLEFATELGCEDSVKMLLEAGANVNCQSWHDSFTPLMYAISEGDPDIVKLLLTYNPDMTMRNKWGTTAFDLVIGNDKTMFTILADSCQSLRKEYFSTASVRISAEKGHEDILKILIDLQIPVDEAGRDLALTPLYLAASNGHRALVRTLLENYAEVNRKIGDGTTALSVAARYGHIDVIKLLIEYEADQNNRDWQGRTPLFEAAMMDHSAVVQLLLEYGAPVDQRNNNGETPLICVIKPGGENVVRLLLDHGADVNARSNNGKTALHRALHRAVRRGYEEIIKILLENNASVDIKDSEGQTPHDFAIEMGSEAIAKLLSESRAGQEDN